MPLPHHLCVFQLRERGEEKFEPRRSIQGRYIRARAHPVWLYLNGKVYLAPPLTKLQCDQFTLLVAEICLIFAAVEFMTRVWAEKKYYPHYSLKNPPH